jgi:sporulation integral membrane protein YtvI
MKEKIQTYSQIAFGALSGIILLYLLIKYLLPITLPFLIAWVMAMATRAPARRLSRQIRVPEKVLRLMMSLFLTLFVFSAIALIIWQATTALWDFFGNAGEGSALYEFFDALASLKLPIFGEAVPEALAEKISDAVSAMLSAAFSALAGGVTSFVGALPRVLLFLLVTVISLVYFALDLERINAFIKSLLPPGMRERASRLREGVLSAGGRFIRSYFIISLITYAILLAGFLVLRVSRPALIALFVAALDFLPVIGVGTVLIPWGVIQIALGKHFLGIGLLVLFVVNATVRQFSEPKIVGKSLNMHPVLTLLLIYVGYALFGIMGLLTLPLIAVVLGVLLQKNHSAEVP